jgi:NADH dehydrogenase FAD-containing subunit
LQNFITDLRESVEKQFNSLKIEFVNDEVVSISGKFILLKSGNSICFDHLIFANGNVYKNPERVPLNTGKVISIEKLWQSPIESNLIIYAKNNH